MAAENDGAYLVKAGPLTTLTAIENEFQKGKLLIGLKKIMNWEKGFKYNLLERLQTNGLRTLRNLLKNYFEAESTVLEKTFYRELQIPRSEFISAHKVPFLRQKIVSSRVSVDRTDQRFLLALRLSGRPLLQMCSWKV